MKVSEVLVINTANRLVACKPLTHTETQNASAFSAWSVKNPLVELEVVYSDADGKYGIGSNIYLRPFVDAPGFMKEIFTLCEKEIVLVPVEYIVAHKTKNSGNGIFADVKYEDCQCLPGADNV